MKILAVCGLGQGTSLLLRMNIEDVCRELGIQADVDHMDVSSAASERADVIIASPQLAPLLAGPAAGQAAAGPSAADGKQRLQSVVDQTLKVPVSDQAATYRRLLRAAVPAELLSDARLEELLDPAGYLGQAAEISRRILAAYPEYCVRGTGTGDGVTEPSISAPLPTTDLNGASRG